MPTYVLSKLKRSIAGQKVGDLVDQEPPTAAISELVANQDKIVVVDDDVLKVMSRANLLTWLASNLSLPWNRVSGKPATFSPAAHQHAAADTTSGVFDASRIPNVPQLLKLSAEADKDLTVGVESSTVLSAATGGTASYTYTLTGLPPGMAFAAGTRTLSGTPTTPGEHELIYTVADSGTPQQTASQEFMITVDPMGHRYIAVTTDRNISSAEITAGNDYDADERNLELPTWTGNRYIVIAQPASHADLTRISLAGLGNSISDFEKAGYQRMIAGLAYEIWVSLEEQGQAISGEIIEVLP